MPSFFPLDVLDEIWDLIESVSEGFPTYSVALPKLTEDYEIHSFFHSASIQPFRNSHLQRLEYFQFTLEKEKVHSGNTTNQLEFDETIYFNDVMNM